MVPRGFEPGTSRMQGNSHSDMRDNIPDANSTTSNQLLNDAIYSSDVIITAADKDSKVTGQSSRGQSRNRELLNGYF